jgi:hypothetical protein
VGVSSPARVFEEKIPKCQCLSLASHLKCLIFGFAAQAREEMNRCIRALCAAPRRRRAIELFSVSSCMPIPP